VAIEVPEVDVSTVISILALIISATSLGISWYFGFRDRYKLKTECVYFPESEYGPATLRVRVVNVGRRMAILRLFGGNHVGGGTSGEYLDHKSGGLTLKENEVFERTLDKEGIHDMGPDGEIVQYKVLWIEDTRGHRHKISKSRKYIRRLIRDAK